MLDRWDYYNTGKMHEGSTIIIAGNNMLLSKKSGDDVCKPE